MAIVTTKKWPDNRMRLESDGTEELRMPGCVHIADAEDALVVVLPKLSESTLVLDVMFPQLLQQYQECSDLMGLFGKHDSARVSLPKELSRDVQRFETASSS